VLSSSSSLSFGDWEADWEAVPDPLESRDEWFCYWDEPLRGGSGVGEMSQKQLVRALSKTFRDFEKQIVEAVVREVWQDFDEEKTGILEREVLMKSQTGLVDTAHMVLMWSS